MWNHRSKISHMFFSQMYTSSDLRESLRKKNALTYMCHPLNSECWTSWALSVFFNFFNNKKLFFCILKNKVKNLFLHPPYLKSPLPVKLTWEKMQDIIFWLVEKLKKSESAQLWTVEQWTLGENWYPRLLEGVGGWGVFSTILHTYTLIFILHTDKGSPISAPSAS